MAMSNPPRRFALRTPVTMLIMVAAATPFAATADDLLQELKAKGTTREILNRMLSHRELFDLFEFDHWVDLEAKYLKRPV